MGQPFSCFLRVHSCQSANAFANGGWLEASLQGSGVSGYGPRIRRHGVETAALAPRDKRLPGLVVGSQGCASTGSRIFHGL